MLEPINDAGGAAESAAWALARMKLGSGGHASWHQRTQIGEHLRSFCSSIGATMHIAMACRRHLANSAFLRPVYAAPQGLYGMIADPAVQKPFSYLAGHDPFASRNLISPLRDDPFHIALYEIRDEDLVRSPGVKTEYIDWVKSSLRKFQERAGTTPDADAFSDLSRGFFDQKVRYVLTMARSAENVDMSGGTPKVCLEFAYTICFSRETTIGEAELVHIGREAIKLAKTIKEATDLITEYDAILFRKESFAFLKEITPFFLDRSISFAEKMTVALHFTKRLMLDHLIGVDIRDLPDAEASSIEDYSAHIPLSAAPWVYFVETRFSIRRDPHEKVEPRFQLYPHIDRDENKVGAFLIAHPKIPSVAKWHLAQYFRRTRTFEKPAHDRRQFVRTELEDAFSGLFSNFEDPQRPIRVEHEIIDRRGNAVTCPHAALISSFNQEVIWNELNRDVNFVSEGDKLEYRQSICSFVIEGPELEASHDAVHPSRGVVDSQGILRSLPLGVLTFESAIVDGFSQQEFAALSELASGLSTLIRAARHASGSSDYEEIIVRTFEDDTPGEETLETVDGDHVRRGLYHYLYHVVRMDASIYEAIIQSRDDRIDRYTGLSRADRAELFSLHKDILIGLSDTDTRNASVDVEAAPNVDIHSILRGRRNTFINNRKSLLQAYNRLGASKVLNFFKACPSNFVWAGYLEAIAQILGDRATHGEIRFKRIGPGFSADAILIASVADEMQQIVKMSSAQKLRREMRNYREFVRYRVPFAARLPSQAFAMDTGGRQTRELLTRCASLEQFLHERRSVALDPNYDDRAGFGALVSDLVDGKSREPGGEGQSESILTLIRRAYLESTSGEDARNVQTTVLNAISAKFGMGVNLWNSLDSDEVQAAERQVKGSRADTGMDIVVSVANCFRLRSGSGSPFGLRLRVPGDEDVVRSALASLILELMSWFVQKRSTSRTAPDEDMVMAIREDPIGWLNSHLHDRAAAFVKDEMISYSRDWLCIGHRDLNARNLAWARVFERFFLIDFEHTGYSLVGVDQWRYVMSVLCDCYWSAKIVKHADGDNLRKGIERAIESLDDITDILERRVTNVSLGHIPADFDKGSETPDDFVQKIALTTLSTLLRKRDGATDMWPSFVKDAIDRKRPWMLMGLCAAAKELEYCFRELDAETCKLLLPPAPVAKRGAGKAKKAAVARGPAEIVAGIYKNNQVPDRSRVASRLVFGLSAMLAVAWPPANGDPSA